MAVPATSAPPHLTGDAGRRLTALMVAAVLFLGRVAAQLIQWWLDVAWLPSFDAWQSGALPFFVLVTARLGTEQER